MRRFTALRSALVFGSLCAFAVVGAPTSSLAADQAIVLSPVLPATVAVPQPNPDLSQLQTDFDIFSWQTFVALNWPANSNGTPNTDVTIGQQGALTQSVWETWKELIEVFKDDGTPPAPWGAPQPVRAAGVQDPDRPRRQQGPAAPRQEAGRAVFLDPAFPDRSADRSERPVRPVRNLDQQVDVRLHRQQRALQHPGPAAFRRRGQEGRFRLYQQRNLRHRRRHGQGRLEDPGAGRRQDPVLYPEGAGLDAGHHQHDSADPCHLRRVRCRHDRPPHRDEGPEQLAMGLVHVRAQGQRAGSRQPAGQASPTASTTRTARTAPRSTSRRRVPGTRPSRASRPRSPASPRSTLRRRR